MIEQAVSYLEVTQNGDGGWGYFGGQQSAVEPTSAAVIGLAAASRDRLAREAAMDWLLSAQNADGGWGLTMGDGDSGWQTAWALLALDGYGLAAAVVERGRNWLLAADFLHFQETDVGEGKDPVLGIDLKLNGWPWQPGQATWVEPTALALLALRHPPTGAQPRLNEAVAYLLDRRCQGGGWNVGNPYMFGAALPARAQPTALALVALTHSLVEAITTSDLETLHRESHHEGTAWATALSALALRALDEDVTEEQASLRALQGGDGGWEGSPYATGLALLALSGEL